ncbi:MAG: hypothetical protein GQ535_14500 [Rhodobacteraceae bacterium]|nr:hypothetical protein [Paracoccaceae bacterium]
MDDNIQAIIHRIQELEEELETAFSERKEAFEYTIEKKRVRFQKETLRWQKQFRTTIARYLFKARPLVWITSPVIYSLIVPFALLDAWVWLYQRICFPAYGIPQVKRADYIVIDRQHLAYLNALEKINCVYCAYGNGVLAYASEAAARTEAYWCPIKHARRKAAYHRWYNEFADYGDAKHYREGVEKNRKAVREADTAD